ncbi:MAG TPA: DUF4235 domain-containing protein [Thermoleophilaceae bacterium]|jgi:hypothetical protein
MKLLFLPFSILGGILAGFISKKLFEQVWGVIDSEEPPEAKHKEISLVKMLAALALEGAIFRAVKGLTDHGTRKSFQKVTGSWPGEEKPEPE